MNHFLQSASDLCVRLSLVKLSVKSLLQASAPRALKACLLTLSLSLSACSTTPQTLVDYDTSQDLSVLKTYRWATAQESSDGKATEKSTEKTAANGANKDDKDKGDLLGKRITRAVDAALQDQSITSQETQTDFLVSQEVVTKSQTYRDTYYYDPFSIEIGHYGSIFDRCGRHQRSCLGASHHMVGETREYTVTQKFLVLRFLNAKDQQVLWKGIVAIPANSARQTALEYDAKVTSAVNALLSQFPVQQTSK